MTTKQDWQELFYELLEKIDSIGDTYDAVVVTRQFADKASELEMRD
jgi:hypothetical protein